MNIYNESFGVMQMTSLHVFAIMCVLGAVCFCRELWWGNFLTGSIEYVCLSVSIFSLHTVKRVVMRRFCYTFSFVIFMMPNVKPYKDFLFLICGVMVMGFFFFLSSLKEKSTLKHITNVFARFVSELWLWGACRHSWQY